MGLWWFEFKQLEVEASVRIRLRVIGGGNMMKVETQGSGFGDFELKDGSGLVVVATGTD